MKKSVFCGLFVALSLSAAAFAGDVATFVNKGFSEDGKYYVFGQYGKTDKKFQGWAEIYQVDIAKNEFVKDGVFTIKASSATDDKNGFDVYESLEAKSYYHFKNLNCEPANLEHTLYIVDDVNKTGTDEIVFQDFSGSKLDNPYTYHIQLVPTINGKGKNAKSSFYINVEKRDVDNKVVLSKKVGTPSVVRKGVINYKIEKIFCDKTGKSLVFVVEKMIEDDTGISIRYMVETAQF